MSRQEAMAGQPSSGHYIAMLVGSTPNPVGAQLGAAPADAAFINHRPAACSCCRSTAVDDTY